MLECTRRSVLVRGETVHIGVIFPQNEIGTDPGAIREYAQAVGGDGLYAYRGDRPRPRCQHRKPA